MNIILLQIFQQGKGERGKDQQDAVLFEVKCKVQILNLKGLHFGVKTVEKHYVFHHVSKFTTQKLISNYML